MIYVGIDPGKAGYISAVRDNSILWFERVPTFKSGKSTKRFDRRAIKDLVDRLCATDNDERVHVVIEKQQTHPRQGAVSAFTTGYGYGLLVMALEGRVPYTEVTPSVWKRSLGLTLTGKAKGLSRPTKKKRLKAMAVREAQRLMPDESFIPPRARKPNADLAEATLLAIYGRRKGL